MSVELLSLFEQIASNKLDYAGINRINAQIMQLLQDPKCLPYLTSKISSNPSDRIFIIITGTLKTALKIHEKTIVPEFYRTTWEQISTLFFQVSIAKKNSLISLLSKIFVFLPQDYRKSQFFGLLSNQSLWPSEEYINLMSLLLGNLDASDLSPQKELFQNFLTFTISRFYPSCTTFLFNYLLILDYTIDSEEEKTAAISPYQPLITNFLLHYLQLRDAEQIGQICYNLTQIYTFFPANPIFNIQQVFQPLLQSILLKKPGSVPNSQQFFYSSSTRSQLLSLLGIIVNSDPFYEIDINSFFGKFLIPIMLGFNESTEDDSEYLYKSSASTLIWTLFKRLSSSNIISLTMTLIGSLLSESNLSPPSISTSFILLENAMFLCKEGFENDQARSKIYELFLKSFFEKENNEIFIESYNFVKRFPSYFYPLFAQNPIHFFDLVIENFTEEKFRMLQLHSIIIMSNEYTTKNGEIFQQLYQKLFGLLTVNNIEEHRYFFHFSSFFHLIVSSSDELIQPNLPQIVPLLMSLITNSKNLFLPVCIQFLDFLIPKFPSALEQVVSPTFLQFLFSKCIIDDDIELSTDAISLSSQILETYPSLTESFIPFIQKGIEVCSESPETIDTNESSELVQNHDRLFNRNFEWIGLFSSYLGRPELVHNEDLEPIFKCVYSYFILYNTLPNVQKLFHCIRICFTYLPRHIDYNLIENNLFNKIIRVLIFLNREPNFLQLSYYIKFFGKLIKDYQLSLMKISIKSSPETIVPFLPSLISTIFKHIIQTQNPISKQYYITYDQIQSVRYFFKQVIKVEFKTNNSKEQISQLFQEYLPFILSLCNVDEGFKITGNIGLITFGFSLLSYLLHYSNLVSLEMAMETLPKALLVMRQDDCVEFASPTFVYYLFSDNPLYVKQKIDISSVYTLLIGKIQAILPNFHKTTHYFLPLINLFSFYTQNNPEIPVEHINLVLSLIPQISYLQLSQFYPSFIQIISNCYDRIANPSIKQSINKFIINILVQPFEYILDILDPQTLQLELAMAKKILKLLSPQDILIIINNNERNASILHQNISRLST